MRVRVGAAAGLLVTVALAGCGSGGLEVSSSDTATSSSATATADATATTDATASTGSPPRRHGRNRHQPDVPPATPVGLAATTGYGTYERCQGTCAGAVPAALRRPLKLPSDDGGPCPITLNPQPASPRQILAGVGFRRVSGSPWLIAGVTWTVPGAYTGPLLIRGGMLGGGALGFGTGTVPDDELQLLDAGQGAPHVAGGGRAWITYTRIRTAGCYAYQVDGIGFSEVVVFRAVA